MTRTGRPRRSKVAALALGACLLLAVAGCGSDAEGGDGKTLRYSSIIPDTTAAMQVNVDWAKRVQDASSGALEVESFYAGSLIAAGDELQALSGGRVDLAYFTPAYYPDQFPLWSIAGVPFVTADPEAQALAFAEMYQNNAAFRAEFERNGIRPLYFLPTGPTVVGMTRPTTSLAELQGKRLRSVGLLAEALRTVGVEPVATGATEIYEAVERGVLDGYSAATFEIMAGYKLQEVAPYVLQTDLGLFASAATVISESTWGSLSPEQQAALQSASETAIEDAVTKFATAEDGACTALLDAGGSVTTLPASDVEEWRSRVGTGVADAWRKTAVAGGTDPATVDGFLRDFTAAVAKFEAGSGYTDGLARCAERSRGGASR